MMPVPYVAEIKLALLLAAVVGLFSLGWHFGGLGPKASLTEYESKQAETVAAAVMAERASEQVTRAHDQLTENTHAQDIIRIASTPALTTPVFVSVPGSLCVGTLPRAETNAGGVAADPDRGPGQPMDRGRSGGQDIRPELEALKKRLELVMADYRELAAEWPR